VFDVSVLQEVAAENDAELKSRLDELEKLWILLLRAYDEAIT